jgi:hypothetical protein
MESLTASSTLKESADGSILTTLKTGLTMKKIAAQIIRILLNSCNYRIAVGCN